MKTTKSGWLGALLLAGASLAAQDPGASWQHHNFSIAIGGQDGGYQNYQYSYYNYYGGPQVTDRVQASSGVIFELRYGYQFSRNWEFTVGTSGYSNKVKYSTYDGTSWTQWGDATLDTSVLMMGMKGHWYPSGRGFNLYGGGEAGYGVIDGAGYSKDGGFAWAASAGAEFPLANHFRLRLEAKHLGLSVTQPMNYYYYRNSAGPGKPAFNSVAAVFVFGWGD